MVSLMQRRREMMQAANAPVIVYTPLSSNPPSSWSKTARVTVSGNNITFNPNALDWNTQVCTNGLLYRYNQLKDGYWHIGFDYVASGVASNGYFMAGVALFQNANATVSATRQAYDKGGAKTPKGVSGSGRVDLYGKFDTTNWSATPNASYYVGVKFYAYTGANSQVTISNIVLEISA